MGRGYRFTFGEGEARTISLSGESITRSREVVSRADKPSVSFLGLISFRDELSDGEEKNFFFYPPCEADEGVQECEQQCWSVER